jgi:hypothetical protein
MQFTRRGGNFELLRESPRAKRKGRSGTTGLRDYGKRRASRKGQSGKREGRSARALSVTSYRLSVIGRRALGKGGKQTTGLRDYGSSREARSS